MSIQEGAKATTENIESKAQETMGEVTGDPEATIEGEGQEIDAQTRHAAEDLKEEIDHKLD